MNRIDLNEERRRIGEDVARKVWLSDSREEPSALMPRFCTAEDLERRRQELKYRLFPELAPTFAGWMRRQWQMFAETLSNMPFPR